jgi:molybdopterin-dependent oxidoreductase alpha subunit
MTTSRAPLLPRPYKPAAAGPGAVFQSLRYALQTSGAARGVHVFLHVNQQDGFDCPGCAWPDPAHRSMVEFCENGARAVAHEADTRKVDRAFFAAHSLAELRGKSDHWLEHEGRLVEPMVLREGATHYAPIAWSEAFDVIARELQGIGPDEAAFYTSGRASNEAAFLYQLFARAYGTNNLPDCSNMCHESSGKGLSTTIGIGKGTVQLDDFEQCDLILIIGQNPGTNHPRMLTTLQEAAKRGCKIVSINPLRERALERFAHPQNPLGILGQGTNISSQYIQVKINGDVALLKGVMKRVLERGGQDRAFLAEHTTGLADLVKSVESASWDDILTGSGATRDEIEELATTYLNSERVIACWAMGITQHENAVGTVREIVNLLALRGNLGKPGAGVCPVRGHSNVQGDRTMGIYEAPSESWLAKMDAGTGITSPRKHGYDVVDTIAAMEDGRVKAFVALGGNFAAATPDTPRTFQALSKCALTVQISTKLNRSHLVTGKTALILPCLGRTETDVQKGGPQFVTVENSMGVVHRSEGRLPPAGKELRSEPWIVAHMARAVLPRSSIAWTELVENYDRIRDLIERSVAGFAGFNARVRAPDGFLLPNGARERKWHTKSGKVELTAQPIPRLGALTPAEGGTQLVLMTIRTHDQFNTTIYDVNDRYRGLYGKRRVVLAHPDDIGALGFKSGDMVDVTSHFKGTTRTAASFELVAYDIPRGCCASYFPEANALVPLESRAAESGTPTSKSVIVTFSRAAS